MPVHFFNFFNLKLSAMYLPAIKYGFFMGSISVLMTLMVYIFNPAIFASMAYGVSSMFLMLAVLVLFGFMARRESAHGFTFKDAFLTLLIIQSFAFMESNLFNYILYNFIDPNLAELIKKETIENTLNLMQSLGVKGDELDVVAESIEKQDMNFGIKQLFIGIGTGIGAGAILSLIIGLILRNKRA
jgi:hypothetical protein